MPLTCENLVEHRGIEPLTSGLQILLDTHLSWCFIMIIAFKQPIYHLRLKVLRRNMVAFCGHFSSESFGLL